MNTIRLIRGEKEDHDDFFFRCSEKALELNYTKLYQDHDYCEITFNQLNNDKYTQITRK